MPWHFGGPETLTRLEAEAYMKHFMQKKEAEAKQARDMKRQGPGRR